MDISKLPSQLMKEAEKSPVKAGALGLLTVVALWFWAPLLWGWLRPADNAPIAATPEAAPNAPHPTAITPAMGATAPIQLDWQGLLRARLNDSKMAVATWQPTARDPFREIVAKVAPIEKPVEAIVAAPQTPVKTLSELGLVLQGVMLGSKIQSATISGFTLPQGAKFAVDKDGRISRKIASDSPATVIEVREIRAAEVVLRSDGKEFSLPLRKRSSTGGTIEITRTSSAP